LRTILRIGVVMLAVVVAGVSAVAGWFYFYTWDLPEVTQLKRFDPQVATELVTRECGLEHRFIAIPADELGDNFRNALLAAESPRETDYATRLALNMFCEAQMRMLRRHLNEARTAIQLRRRFSREQLLVIYANQAYFGDNVYGAEAAARHFFNKPAKELAVGEAALLAGLLQRPKYYSPYKYPTRALERRNYVLNAMVASGSLSSADAERAKNMPLSTTLHQSVSP
jgi:membrane peptidoglycan carboxypeptidase